MHALRALVLVFSLAASASTAAPLDTFRDCDVCPEMIELPMGEFVMGAPNDEFRRIVYWRDGAVRLATEEAPYVPENEGPQHKVVVDIPIAMGKNEVTYAEWMACVDDGGCNGYVPDNRIGSVGTDDAILRTLTDARFKDLPSNKAMLAALGANDFLRIGGNYPVMRKSYNDAQAYVAWLNRKLDTDAYRLPSEAEWEYAARAGTTARFAQGFEPSPGQVNISGVSTAMVLHADRPDLYDLGWPVPVDELDAANVWGLRHMSGNAGEITLSCYSVRYTGWSSTSMWLAKSFDEGCEAHTERGGSYGSPMDGARVASRLEIDADIERAQTTGFRIVKELN